MQKFYSRGLLACLSLITLISCQDFDGGFDSDTIKKASYAKDFEKTFGTPDPNQNWSMAQKIGVNVSVPNMDAGEVTIYTNSPLGSNCKILGQAKVSDGIAQLNIDVVKGTSSVYVVAKNQDGMAINGYFDIKDNALNIAKGVVTRAAGTPATIGDEMNVNIYMLPTVAEMMQNSYYSKNDPSGDNIVGSWNGAQTVQKIPNLYMLDGVDLSTRTDELMLGDLATFLRSYTNIQGTVKDGVFKEGANHVPLMGSEIEADASYTMAADGPITLDYVYKGTVERHNYFGYFYYPESEEMTADKFRNLKKYVVCPFITGNANCSYDEIDEYTKFYLYTKNGEEVKRTYNYHDSQYNESEDGEPQTDGTEWWWNGTQNVEVPAQISSNEKTGSHYEWRDHEADGSLLQWAAPVYAWDATAGTNLPTGEYNDWTNIGGMAMPSTIANSINDIYKLRGTKIQLTFFGYDGTSTPTFTFPEGCKVGFFFVKFKEHGVSGGDTSFNKLYTSFATLNRDLINEVPTGATFRYRDYVVLGMEDQPYGDKDQNDILFLAQGNFKDIPDITPNDDPEKDPEPQKWLIACEDLGGSFDYDFNDIVIGFEKKDGHLWMKPLAACGTLPSYISYDGVTSDALKEIHQMLGAAASNGIYSIIPSNFGVSPIDLGEIADDADIATALKKLKIKVENEKEATVLEAAWNQDIQSKIPQMLLLPGDWDWPIESEEITKVYNGFQKWVEDASYTGWTKKNGAKYITNTWGK